MYLFINPFNISRRQAWSEKTEAWIRRSCWALNIGLAGMVFVSLMPLGFIQLADAVANGYWHARSLEYLGGGLPRLLEWARMPGDVVFIAAGAAPMAAAAFLTLVRMRRRGAAAQPAP